MPARSKRFKANGEISGKKYRVGLQADVDEPELNKPLGNHDLAEDDTQTEYDETEPQGQPPNAELVYFAEADKSLKPSLSIRIGKAKYQGQTSKKMVNGVSTHRATKVAGRRGKHPKRQSPLSDEDVKSKYLVIFRALGQNCTNAQEIL
ncbi:hypothetical protein V1525DRAFT_435413 [Lipomyces kononenkoae]|uniref:Uncharacterized protein n=1 Tax=Lipomyces kononenkoae TaxID=34357 RepID=A0ACC3SSS5_LIPKO